MNTVKSPSHQMHQVLDGKGKPQTNGPSLQVNARDISSNWKKLIQEHPEQVSNSQNKQNFVHKPMRNRRPKTEQNSTLTQKPHDQGSTEQNKQQIPYQPRHKQTLEKAPTTQKKLDIWFDGVDESLLEPMMAMAAVQGPAISSAKSLVAQSGITGITRHVAVDCEMVGAGKNGEDDILARVSIVNQFGHCLYDKYVKPREKVTDYRTRFSGIRPAHLKDAEEFDVVQKEVAKIIHGKILVGHAVHNDLKVLFLGHPRQRIRDTSRYKPFRKMIGCGGTPSLKRLTEKLLGVSVQQGSHDSVEDAQAAMKLYMLHKLQWEASLKQKKSKSKEPQHERKLQQVDANKFPVNNKNADCKPDGGNKETLQKVPTHVAVDCEMVGGGKLGDKNILARVSLVNERGDCLYDKYVKPGEEVTDYRTHISGITPELVQNAEEFAKVQKEVKDIIKGKFLIGHSLHYDLKVLRLEHPSKKIRDTAMYKPFREMINFKRWQIPSLQKLAEKLLGVKFQEGSHDSIEDARVAMQLYTKYKVQWEIRANRKR